MNTPHHQRRTPLPPQLMNVPNLPQKNMEHIRSLSPEPASYPPPFGSTPTINTTAIVPFVPAAETPIEPVVTEAVAKKSSFSINDIKQVIDRMGGIDGMVETMGKVQKVMNSVSQIAPAAKLLMGTLLPSKRKGGDSIEEDHWTKMPRKRRRKRKAAKGRAPASGHQRRRPAKPRRH